MLMSRSKYILFAVFALLAAGVHLHKRQREIISVRETVSLMIVFL